MLPKSEKDRANWKSECPVGDYDKHRTCGTGYHLTKADAKARDDSHKHDLEIEKVES